MSDRRTPLGAERAAAPSVRPSVRPEDTRGKGGREEWERDGAAAVKDTTERAGDRPSVVSRVREGGGGPLALAVCCVSVDYLLSPMERTDEEELLLRRRKRKVS